MSHNKPHMPCSSCAHETICQYICPLYTKCNQQCEQVYIHIHMHFMLWVYTPEQQCLGNCTYMSHCTTIAIYIRDPHYFTCKFKNQESATGTPYIIANYVPETNMPLKCHIYEFYHVQKSDNNVSTYTS